MRHFQNPNDGNKVYGYDSQDATQAELLQAAIDGGWIEVTGNWPPAPALLERQAKAWGGIKAKRTAVELGGVKVGTKWYHTDDASRIKYLGLFKLAEQALAAGAVGTTVLQYNATDIKWKTMDGTFINMTVQRAQDVYFAVFGLDMAAFAAAETHKVAMEAAADPAAYDFSAGWPASFPAV
jgi:hypothetical protein